MNCTIATAPRIDIIVPRPANLGTPLDDNEIPTMAAFDQVDGSTEPYDLASACMFWYDVDNISSEYLRCPHQ